jgi:hypothetical protein
MREHQIIVRRKQNHHRPRKQYYLQPVKNTARLNQNVKQPLKNRKRVDHNVKQNTRTRVKTEPRRVEPNNTSTTSGGAATPPPPTLSRR